MTTPAGFSSGKALQLAVLDFGENVEWAAQKVSSRLANYLGTCVVQYVVNKNFFFGREQFQSTANTAANVAFRFFGGVALIGLFLGYRQKAIISGTLGFVFYAAIEHTARRILEMNPAGEK